jgi:CubicO group peptidase (beta-lactamase class C family)
MHARAFAAPWLYLLLAGMHLLHGNGWSGQETSPDLTSIDAYVAARMRSARIPGVALAIVQGERIGYLRGYGRADQSGRPVTPETPFIIGSITKSMTALAVMQLVEDGLVELDAPVQRYIPWFRLADPSSSARITVRMLIDQTSGIPQSPTLVTWNWPNDANAIERHVRLLAKAEPAFAPGRSFAYSNGNYVALGMLVQAVTGQSYEDYVRERIFRPLDMRHSHVAQEEAERDGLATGYRWWFGYPIPATLPFNRANLPAGFAISSAEDMAHYLIAQVNGGRYGDVAVLSPEGIAAMQAEPPPGTFGLGWESVRIDGRRLINFDGATGNYQASIFIDPEERVGVFVAANAMSALDGLSSSRASSSLGARSLGELVRRLLGRGEDRGFLVSALITTRGMAHSVLNAATGRPMPEQGLGQRRVALIVYLAVLGLTGALILSLVGIPQGYGQLALQGVPGRPELLGRILPIAATHLVWPLILLYVALQVPYWIIISLYQPDVVLWLKAVAVVVFLKGLLQIALVWRVYAEVP